MYIASKYYFATISSQLSHITQPSFHFQHSLVRTTSFCKNKSKKKKARTTSLKLSLRRHTTAAYTHLAFCTVNDKCDVANFPFQNQLQRKVTGSQMLPKTVDLFPTDEHFRFRVHFSSCQMGQNSYRLDAIEQNSHL